MTDTGGTTVEREHLLYDRLIACLEVDGLARLALRAPIEADFPDFADELREFFEGEDILERITRPLRLSSRSATSTAWGSAGSNAASPAAPPSLSEYELIAEIARGGMGVVYAARHKALGRSVALKTIRSGGAASDEDVRRFREEARRVDHPDIVPLYDAGHEGLHHYFTMRLMEGGSLADRLASGRFTPRQAAAVVSRIARALHFAHQRGVLHRDVKPANILFDKEGRPHIGDFGLASQLSVVSSQLSAAGDARGEGSRGDSVGGTPMYMAPEVVKRVGELTTAVDVYGLGAVLYEMLTGRPPFRAGSLLETLSDLANREPERPSALVREVDPDLEAICLKCLDKEPARRYGSAEALADDLERWLRGEPVEARHCPGWRRIAKWARRSPVVAVLSGLSVVATVACIGALAVSNITINREKGEKTLALEAKTNALAALSQLRENERHLTYLQGIALADRELQSGSRTRAEKLLRELPPELRGLEWNYLQGLCHAERRSLGTPADPACVAVHPVDGRVYVGGGLLGGPGEIAVYDEALKGELFRSRFSDSVTALALSADGQRLVTAIRGGGARVLSTASGKETVAFHRHEGDVRAVAFSADGRRVVSGGSDGAARIWDAATGRETVTLREAGVTIWSVAFSPDGRRVATGSSGRTIGLWDAESGRRLRTIVGHRALVRSVAFSPDGRRLVSAAHDGTARVWDADGGSELASLVGHTGFVTRAVFSPDGLRIATTGVDGTVRLWDAATWEQVALLRGHSGSVWDAAFSRDGRDLVSAGEDGMVKLWPGTPHGMPRLLDRADRRIRRIEGSADGRALAVLGEDGSLEVWDTETDRRRCAVAGSYVERSRFTLSGDGSSLAVHFEWQVVRVIRTIDGSVVRDIRSPALAELAPALSDDGDFLAIAQTDRRITVWDIRETRVVERVEQPEGELRQLAIGPGAAVLAAAIVPTGGGVGRVVLWRTGSAQAPVEVPGGSRIGLSPRGDLLAAFGDTGIVNVYRTDSGLLAYRLDGMSGPVRAIAFDGPGRLLTGDERGTVTIWDTRDQREILSLRDMSGPVDFLALPGGRAVLGMSRAGQARQWEVAAAAGGSGDRDGPVATLGEEHKP
jgi:WD40 repeat protein